jgi:hypothetical protein
MVEVDLIMTDHDGRTVAFVRIGDKVVKEELNGKNWFGCSSVTVTGQSVRSGGCWRPRHERRSGSSSCPFYGTKG